MKSKKHVIYEKESFARMKMMKIIKIEKRLKKCDWYEHGQKSTIFFLNLEKQQGAQNTIKKLIIDDTEVTDQTCILNHIKDFYEALYKKREPKTMAEIIFF